MKRFGLGAFAVLLALAGGSADWRIGLAFPAPARAWQDAGDGVEEEIEADVEEEVESDVEEDIEEDIESDVEDEIETEIEDEVENEVEDETEEDIEDHAEEEFEAEFEEAEDEGKRGAGGERAGSAGSVEFGGFEIDFDDEAREIRAGERVLLLEPEKVAVLADRGFRALEVQALEGMELVLARIEIPQGFDIEAESEAIAAADPGAKIDFNHIYRPEADDDSNGRSGFQPASFIMRGTAAKRDAQDETQEPRPAEPARIGLIDTKIDLHHLAFDGRRIISRDFVNASGSRPLAHGTAVASILVGKSAAFAGLLPDAELAAASVFYEHVTGGVMTSVDSLVKALDWMIVNDVRIVNMSLSGPPNVVLETAINRALEKGIVIVAAAGNHGPVADPAYPAAYEGVIAITAVNRDNQVYRLAGRGRHIDFAAPGVDVLSASIDGGYAVQSGTSMAAPFATAVIAMRRQQASATGDQRPILPSLIETSIDLGPKGFDTTYGYGLIQP